MKKSTKIWLIVAASLIVLGIAVFGGAMMVLKWDFKSLVTQRYENSNYEVTETFRDISIRPTTADIVVLLSEDETCRVVCYEQTKLKHEVRVVDGVLTVEEIDTRKWYDCVGINLKSPSVSVYLPNSTYGALRVTGNTCDVEVSKELRFEHTEITVNTGDVKSFATVTGEIKIHTNTGDIALRELSAGSLDLRVTTGDIDVTSVACAGDVSLRVSTGNVKMADVTCRNLNTQGGTGDASLKNVLVAEKLSAERTTGDVGFEGCDAGELFVKTGTGDVVGSLRSEKIFFASTNTGRVEIPRATAGGRCEITTNTGDVRMWIEP